MKKTLLLPLLILTFVFAAPNVTNSNFNSGNISRTSYVSEKVKLTSAASDGFINAWNLLINNYGSVCNIPETEYRVILALYNNLSIADQAIVDAYVFEPSTGATIKNGMDELTRIYRGTSSNQKVVNLDQNTTLILVIVIALIGMTAICIFYSFKDNEIIQ